MMHFPIKDKTSNGLFIAPTVVGISVIILLLAIILGIVLSLYFYRRRYLQQKPNIDQHLSYPQCRGSPQQLQPQLPNDVYDQIQLSPLTGQAEFILKNESKNMNVLQDQQDSKSSVDTEQPQDVSNSIFLEKATYAVSNKNKKKRMQMKLIDFHSNASGKDTESPNDTNPYSPEHKQPPEELYTAVKKNKKRRAGDNEEEVPPLPLHTVEELYTAIQKKPRGSVSGDEAEAPPIPPHTIEELYTAVQKNK